MVSHSLDMEIGGKYVSVGIGATTTGGFSLLSVSVSESVEHEKNIDKASRLKNWQNFMINLSLGYI